MRKESMHRLVEVLYKKVDECPSVDLKFTFFQMVYVISGTGRLNVNGNYIGYQTGNLMLMTPNDRHNFEIAETTEFLVIKLNSDYVKQYKSKSIDHIECLLYYATHLYGCILRNKADEYLVKATTDSLLHAMKHTDMYDEDLILHFVNVLIVIAARNIAKMQPAEVKTSADKKILKIIHYIQDNICAPDKLKVPVIAKKFGVSETYLGSYFKAQCGETLLHFISNYKIRLIEHRLKFSDMRINEIVDEFGFSDESHLNKFFKKHRSVSLTKFRKSAAA